MGSLRASTALLVGLALPLFSTPGRAQAVSDSAAMARALEQFLRDSLEARGRALAQAESILTAPVRFERGQTTLSREAGDLLNTKAWYLWANPAMRIAIRARGDSGAGEKTNVALSKARVDSVRDYIIRRGILSYQIPIQEAGPSPPDSGTSRVEFTPAGRPTVLEIPPPSASLPADPRNFGLGKMFGGISTRTNSTWATVRIFYATDRRRGADSTPENFYTGERSRGELEFGRVEVTVPRIHRPGVIERPAWYRLDLRLELGQHMIVQEIVPLDQATALDSLRRTVARSGSKEALVFIHGYDTSFHDAALRTAQLTYDLGFDGVPILYSWPSRASLFRYQADLESSEWSADHLRVFLDSLVAVTGARRIHLIAHSMGSRALTLALERMAAPARDTVLGNVVLAAADVDAARFEQQIAPAIRRLMERMTVYISAGDKALRLSRLLSANRRVGEAINPILAVNDADVIDASAIKTDLLGHGYIASARDLIDDLELLLNDKRAPPRRLVRETTPQGAVYWRIP